MKIIICFIFCCSGAYAQVHPSEEKYTPTKMEWLVLNLNLSLAGLIENSKPMCSARSKNTVSCIGLLYSKKRNAQVKEMIQRDFEKLVNQLGLVGQVKIDLPE